MGVQFAMDNSALNNLSWTLAKGFIDGFIEFIKLMPWWVWIFLIVLILMSVFNSLMLKERSVAGSRYMNQIELFFNNLIYYLFKRQKVIKSGINDIDNMSGKVFEYYLKYLFERLGFKATHVGTSTSDHRGDMGGDVIIEKDGVKTAIQAKCYRGFVGIDAVREVMGAKNYYQCQKAMVVTNSGFTNEAITMAKVSGVELWDRNKLIGVIAGSKLN
jgi:HJR/Mrr/RecB family endonuclease